MRSNVAISPICRDELGDLLFQVVFQSRIAEEGKHFDFDDVAGSIADKLEARHPHIFGDEELPGGMREERWEALKAAERAEKGANSALEGVAMALPALLRAQKLQKRAARTGFDWPDPEGPSAKLLEEIDELARASTEDERFEEAGGPALCLREPRAERMACRQKRHYDPPTPSSNAVFAPWKR